MDARTEGNSDAAAAPVTPARAVAAGGAASYASIAILSSRPLWDLITAFVSGYPFVVTKLYQQYSTASLKYMCSNGDSEQILIGNLTRKGVLMHLAIASNDLGSLHLLFKLAKHPHYQHDPKFSAKKVMRCVVLFNNVEILSYLNELKAGDPAWKWEPNLMRIALQSADPNMQVLDWLYAHLPRRAYPLYEQDMLRHTENANLDVVKWLHEHNRKI